MLRDILSVPLFFVCSGEKGVPVSGKLIEMGSFPDLTDIQGNT